MFGTITVTFHGKGYHFLRDENGVERFAHCRDFIPRESFDRAYVGQRIEFTPTTDTKGRGNGMRAVEIRPC